MATTAACVAALSFGCSPESTGTGGSGAGTSTAGAAGAPAEGCVEIVVDGTLRPSPNTGLTSVALHPFWRDERGLHAVWEDTEETTGHHSVLVVTTFDPSTGESQQHRVYEPFPVELYEAYVEIFDAVGAPDGRFAAVIAYADDNKRRWRALAPAGR